MSSTSVESTAKPEESKGKRKPGLADAIKVLFTGTGQPESETGVVTRRRRFVTASILGFLSINFLMFLRFFFPRILFEPSTTFKIGFPSDFGVGVDTRFQQKFRIWVVRNTEGLFVIYTKCTHLGCTPDWIASENKFKCPCHGSGYDSEGINFEGPAPRPMDRCEVELAPDGEIIVNAAHLYKWPKGERDEFNDPGAMLHV